MQRAKGRTISARRYNGRWDHELGEYLPSLSATALAREHGRQYVGVNPLFLAVARIEGVREHADFDRNASRFQRR